MILCNQDGDLFVGRDAAEIVSAMHNAAPFAQEPNDAAFMRACAERVLEYYGRRIRSTNPVDFITDLKSVGLLEEPEVN